MINCSCVVVHCLSEAAAHQWHSVFPPPRSCKEHLQLWDDAGYGGAEAAMLSHMPSLITEDQLQTMAALRRPLRVPPPRRR